MSLRSPQMTSPRNRLQVFEVLRTMDFLLNSLLFILIGLQLPTIFGGLSGEPSPATLVLYAAVYIDYDGRFWLNGNYWVYPKTNEQACMEVARMPEGYCAGIYGCLERTWSPESGYRDPFVPLPVLNHRPA